MVLLEREIKVDIEYGCIFGCVANCARYMNMDLSVVELYIYGDGISDINYTRDILSIGNPLQMEIMMAGVSKFNLALNVCQRDANSNSINVWQEDEAYLCKDKPVIIYCESGYLDYNPYFMRNRSMNHTVLLIGIDYNNNLVRIADTYIPTQTVQTFIGTIPLSVITAARQQQKYTSVYLDGEYIMPKISLHEKFFDSLRAYMAPKKTEGKFWGSDLVPFFLEDLSRIARTIEKNKIKEIVSGIYFDIKMRGILTHRSIIGEYLSILASEFENVANKVYKCNQCNEEIEVCWNRIMKKLIRWQATGNYQNVDEIVVLLKKIHQLDLYMVDRLNSIGKELGY